MFTFFASAETITKTNVYTDVRKAVEMEIGLVGFWEYSVTFYEKITNTGSPFCRVRRDAPEMK